MEEPEEQPPREADTEPVVTSGASEAVPRVLPGDPQNLSDVDAFNLLLEMKLKRRRERPNLPRTVTELVAEDGSRVYVVGTAHFSDDSKRDVVKTIREVQPDVVVVELCQYRVSMLKMDERTLLREAKEISLEKLQQAVRQNGVASGLMQMLLLKVSAHITEQLGVAPGGEFREAFKEVGPGATWGWGAGAAPGSPTDTAPSRPHPGQQGSLLQVPPGRPAHPRHLQAGHRRPLPLAEGQVGLGPVLPVGPHQQGRRGALQAEGPAGADDGGDGGRVPRPAPHHRVRARRLPDLHAAPGRPPPGAAARLRRRAQEVRPLRGGGRRGHGPRPRHREELDHRPQHPGDHDRAPAVRLGQSVPPGREGRLPGPPGLRPLLDRAPRRQPAPGPARRPALPAEALRRLAAQVAAQTSRRVLAEGPPRRGPGPALPARPQPAQIKESVHCLSSGLPAAPPPCPSPVGC